GVASLMDYELTWTARVGRNPDSVEFELSVLVPVTSLCPCSKAISEYGAHNQRSHVTATVVYSHAGLADPGARSQGVETDASCELCRLRKRADEQCVTERACENPRRVEDLVRDFAERLRQVAGTQRFRVVAENFESRHNHSAYA